MGLREQVREKALAAKRAARALALLSSTVKNKALSAMADGLVRASERLTAENVKDVEAGKKAGLSSALIDRLTLNPKRIEAMAQGIREIVYLPDPVGEVLEMRRRPNGMEVGRVRVPIGLIGIIYESRPNVTADTSALCLKSGNAVLLRGGSEAIHSNTAIAKVLNEAAAGAGVPDSAISILDTPDRQAVYEMLALEGILDLVIPRGGEGLMRMISEHAKVPVLRHDKGVCHTYIDRETDLDMAESICVNAKVQRPGTCNAMETLLVHQDAAGAFLPRVLSRLAEKKVEIRGCAKTRAIFPDAKPASEADWSNEYLDLILNVKVVGSFEEAVDHIDKYGSQHSDAIVTTSWETARRFLREVDSSAVLVNASTRLHDGYEFGLGAEIGISTTRIHARGTMGLKELTAAKYIVFGSGQVRE
ncbi:MAG: glutamate-5-semialdehyde dehydrogenase [Nitrospirota bacterium]